MPVIIAVLGILIAVAFVASMVIVERVILASEYTR